ncbi:uncharacterized protein LOC125198536 isoform X1 [Salvia hispanica]|uniref:uncharacterized protein LOC125198536 isoform X1 n=1 Tax=Salvia hispanica TaxID=49212 RepID=UPI002009AE41|nr:uncharacterized protein LOC125198536 isoform X1 [Salvia hispanica]
MALITGRINTLNPDPVLKCSTFTANRSDLPPPQHSRSSSEPLSANDQAFFQSGGCEVPIVKANPVEEASSTGTDSRSRDLDVRQHDQKELTAALPSKNVQLSHNHLLNLLRLINAHAVNSSLSSSEDTRAICSALLGLAVVVLQIIHHYAVVKPESLVMFSPLLVVALTDFVIVVVSQARSNKEEEGKYEDEDDGSLDGAVKLLELGLVLHQMICAIFVDCSFYLVVVILGLSLV